MEQMISAGKTDEVEVREGLAEIPSIELRPNELLAPHTRFGIGGPADLLIIARDIPGFIRGLDVVRKSGTPWVVIGGGTNLIVSDAGFRGTVLKFAAGGIRVDTGGMVNVDAGAVLQDLVDQSVAWGLKGLETMTGIPGWVGAAVYGNAGAYGHSISEVVESVTFWDGLRERRFDRAECAFRYRESIFKQHKSWIILHCSLRLTPGDPAELARIAGDILRVRNEKYPPSMRCAGSIFKNFLLAELPETVQALVPGAVVREGKVPSAWFLEQVGAKGMRVGDIQVAAYHANLIYNDGAGSAKDLLTVIRILQERIRERFGIPLEEEVQYVGEFGGS